jgi:hypothetical protein
LSERRLAAYSAAYLSFLTVMKRITRS